MKSRVRTVSSPVVEETNMSSELNAAAPTRRHTQVKGWCFHRGHKSFTLPHELLCTFKEKKEEEPESSIRDDQRS